MTRPTTPYTPHLGDRDPLDAIRDSLARVSTLVGDWTAERFERSYAPGKWSARQVIIHLAQVELALGARARLAVEKPGYVAQPFDQEVWLPFDSQMTGQEALAAFLAIARMNLRFFQGLSPDQRTAVLSHPEYGQLTVDWLVHQMAGHQINHLQQLERIV
jgi:hypothetical protein